MKNSSVYKVFDTKDYWCGDIGYRPGPDGVGYRDFIESNLPRVDYISAKNPGKVLDLGCGFGYLVDHLRRRGIEAYGTDVSQYAFDNSPESVREFLKVESAAELSWPDKFFDMVVSYGVLEHLTPEDANLACKEIIRVSRRGVLAIGLSTELSMQLPPAQQDKTHRTCQGLDWWKSKFPIEYEIWEGSDETWRLANQFKVLVIAPVAYPMGGAGYGGIERLAYLLSRELARRKIDVTVACAQGSKVAPGVKLLEMCQPNSIDYQNNELMAFSIIKPVVDSYSVILDLSHSHFIGRALPYHTRQVSPIWHAPTVMRPPEPLWNVTALSEWQAEAYGIYQNRKAKVLDIHMIDEADSMGKVGVGDRFLAIGRISPRKGYLQTVKICKDLGAQLDIAGPPGEDLGYFNAVIAMCDGSQISYLGELPHKTILNLAATSKALLYTPEEDEAHSHKIVDSLSCGCPVITYNRAAMSEVVKHWTDGFLVTNVNDFKKYMTLVGRLDRSRIKKRARRRWGPGKIGDDLLSLLVESSRGSRWG